MKYLGSITNDKDLSNKSYVDGLVVILTANLAPTYSSSNTYSVGDYVIYDNVLYVCNTAISTAEAWNSSHWTQTSIATVIGNIASALNTINSGGGVS